MSNYFDLLLDIVVGLHMGARKKYTCHLWEMYEARFASIITFRFALKQPKSFHQTRFTGSEYT